MKNEEEKNIKKQSLRHGHHNDPAALSYKDKVNDIDPTNLDVSGSGSATIDLNPIYTIKLFKEKISHFEEIGNDDYLGFTLVFGNSSSRAYEPAPGEMEPTLVDILNLENLDSSISLTLVDLCLPDCYRLTRVVQGDPVSIDPCDGTNNVFRGSQRYPLTLQKCTSCTCNRETCEINCTQWTSVFPIPCQSICCISMLFRIDPSDPCNCEPCDCLPEPTPGEE